MLRNIICDPLWKNEPLAPEFCLGEVSVAGNVVYIGIARTPHVRIQVIHGAVICMQADSPKSGRMRMQYCEYSATSESANFTPGILHCR